MLENNAIGSLGGVSVLTVNNQDNISEVNEMNTDKSRENNVKTPQG